MTAPLSALHPEPEVLAAFVDGNLEGTEQVRLSDHLRDCAECRLIVGEAARFEREQNHSVSWSFRWRAAAVAVAAAAAAAFAVWIIVPRFRDPLEQLQPKDHRAHLGRLTAFEYAPFGVSRSQGERHDYAQRAASAELQERLQEHRTPGNLHRFALAEAALGRNQEARQLLMEARAAQPDDASIIADLAAMEISIGDAAGGVRSAQQALRIDPRSSVAAFNLALGFELLNDRTAAIEKWNDFLLLEPDSRWANEGRARLERLRRSAS